MKAIIFDVDGTLYDQRKLRFRVLSDMVLSYIRRDISLKEIKVIRDFRRERDKISLSGIRGIKEAQYARGAEASGVRPDFVKMVVKKWIFQKPLAYLASSMYEGVPEFFNFLKNKGIKTGIFSDYPSAAKLAAMGLKADAVVSAEDIDVDRLKPHPRGLMVTAEKLGIQIRDAFFIGDRDEKDGECARRAGMKYMILKGNKTEFYKNRHRLWD